MSERVGTTVGERKPRTWQLWERRPVPPRFQFQARDHQIIEAVFTHRFLTVAHIHALLGGSSANLARRCRLLWEHGYLERPKALRPLKVLTEQLVYALGRRGAGELAGSDLKITARDWAETPKKQLGLPYVDHQLAVSTVMVALRVACERRGFLLHWDGHFNRRRWRIDPPGNLEPILPDAFFTIERPDGRSAGHFLEVERSSKSISRLKEKYEGYFHFWKSGRGEQRFGHKLFRVLFLAEDPSYVDFLRRAARPVGRNAQHPHAWKALMFSHLQTFDLEHPEPVLAPIFRHADDETPVALVPQAE